MTHPLNAHTAAHVLELPSGFWVRGHPYMTSALRGEGVSPKEDVVREVA